MKPALCSFFSGSGFLDLGFEMAGFEVSLVNEFHKPFLKAYKHSREKMNIDISNTLFSNDSIEDLVYTSKAEIIEKILKTKRERKQLIGFIGGPPCPDFSVGGKNRGKNGDNGKLTKVYTDALLKFLPDFFVFENVKGLWRTKKHREFYEEIKELLGQNYYLTDRLTNSIEVGVPQDRDRILLFGINKNISKIESNEELSSSFDWKSLIKYDRNKVLNSNLFPHENPYKENISLDSPESIEDFIDLTVEHWFRKNDVENHPNSLHHFMPRQGIKKFKVIPEGDVGKKSYKRLHRWRYSPTAAYGNNEVHLHPYKTRRLSAAEALAIQSLPPEFELPSEMSLTNMFKTIGNGVPFLLSTEFAKIIKRFLFESTHQ